MAHNITRKKSDSLLLLSLFLSELSIAAILMALYMKGERPFTVFLISKPGLIMLCATAALVIGGAVIISQYVAYRRSSLHPFKLIVVMNLLSVMLIVLTGEIATRILSRSSIEGDTLGRVTLVPKKWDALTLHNRRLLNEASSRPTFYVYDSLLGWTLGSNRKSAMGFTIRVLKGCGPHMRV